MLQYYKASGVLPVVADVAPWVEHAIASFGWDRSLHEGNWFFCNYYAPPRLDIFDVWAAMLTKILAGLQPTPAQRASFFAGAGARAYRVNMAP